ncbi:MAG: FAD:protein FMN transferase [Actinomycetota bacterium]|nr:FAD:protein FMN transferase [Actinomycetota bacterium]
MTSQLRGDRLRPAEIASATWRVSFVPATTAPPSTARVAVCERAALGTSARLAIWPAGAQDAACAAVDRILDELDRQVSRFRADSELERAHAAQGLPSLLSQGAADAVTVALAAACVSGGRVDPTVGAALCDLGYDRDFSAIDPRRPPRDPRPAPGWRSVRLHGRVLRTAPGVRLDLGATAKGLGADRAALAALGALDGRGGVLVSLGGDIAVAGPPLGSGWPVGVSEDPGADLDAAAQVVQIRRGGLATSSVLHRRWRSGGTASHHIVDPTTGQPVSGPWRTATVAALSCVEANTASTTAIVAGDDAEDWLRSHDLAARLVGRDGHVQLVGRWPHAMGGQVPIPLRSIFERRDEAARQ